MKIRLRKAKLDQKEASKLIAFNIRFINQKLQSQKKRLGEQLRKEGKLQQFKDFEPLDTLEFEYLKERVEGDFSGLLDTLEIGKYINEKLKNQLLQQAFGILNVGVESIKSSIRARLASFGYTGSLADETISEVEGRVPSVRAELIDKFEKKIFEFNKQYKGYLRIWMEHPFGGEVIKAIMKYAIPALLSVVFGSYFLCEIKISY